LHQLDSAFDKLPPGTLANLLKPENKSILIQILKYHVIAGNLTAQVIIDLHPPVRVETLDGRSVLVIQLLLFRMFLQQMVLFMLLMPFFFLGQFNQRQMNTLSRYNYVDITISFKHIFLIEFFYKQLFSIDSID
jgi:hypothetical protein